MLLLRTLFKLFKVMNSETAAESLAAALALGVFLGLVPLLSLQAGIALLVILFLRVNVTLALVTALATGVLFEALEPSLHGLGVALLDHGGLQGWWALVDGHALLGTMHLTNSVALGGTVVGLIALPLVGSLGLYLVRAYRHRVEGWVQRSRGMAFLKSLRIVQLYRSVTQPFG